MQTQNDEWAVHSPLRDAANDEFLPHERDATRPSWDPYEVWRTRIKWEYDARVTARRAAPISGLGKTTS